MPQRFDYGPAVLIPFPVLVYAILGMRTGLVGLRGVVLHYSTDLFAGLWHSCCLASVLTLFASFPSTLGAIVALHQSWSCWLWHNMHLLTRAKCVFGWPWHGPIDCL